MNLKIKKTHPDAVIPKYAKRGDAGMDLVATTVVIDPDLSTFTYGTGLAIEIPEGYVGLVFPRSSNCKKDLYLTNHVGVIDSGYRGEIKMSYKPDFDHWILSHIRPDFKESITDKGIGIYYDTCEDEFRDRGIEFQVYKIGDRIGQIIIMPYPQIEFEEVENLSETERGSGGYGSTGR